MPGLAKGVSIVVPVYNGELTVPQLVERTVAAMGERAWEMILVNDASRDGSWEVITGLAEKNARVRGVNLARNYGQHSALLCGIRMARYDITATMDDDLQHPPELLPRLIDELDSKTDVVYGAPEKEQHSLWRDSATRLTKLVLQGAMGASNARMVSSLRVFRTRIRESFANFDGPFVAIDPLLTWGTRRFKAIRVPHEPRTIGVSNYTFAKLLVHGLNLMTGYTIWPLQLASLVGFGFMLLGVVALSYVLGRYLIQGTSVPGFSFLASTIALFSGAQLFTLGIIGEYLARMHQRLMRIPSYSVQETTSDEASGIVEPAAGLGRQG